MTRSLSAHRYDGTWRHQRVGGVRTGGLLVWHEGGTPRRMPSIRHRVYL
jgi:hypothetical protein